MNKNIYEERVCLFLDILGFKQFVHDGRERELLDALTIPSEIFEQDHYKNTTVQLTAFSDSIFISEVINRDFPHAVMRVMHFASYLWWRFAIKGVLLRGGMVIGNCFHHGSIAFGPGLISAYNLESDLANYPRIIVSNEVREIFFSINRNPLGNFMNALIRTDFDGLHHVNVFFPVSLPFEMLPDKSNREPFTVDEIKSVMASIVDNILSSRPTELRAAIKYDWLKSYKEALLK